MVQIIFDTLAADGEIHVSGLGTFDVITRHARQGRNPKTQEAIEIPATKTMRFRAGKGAQGPDESCGQRNA
jgi:DNA-binding protein HU-beta